MKAERKKRRVAVCLSGEPRYIGFYDQRARNAFRDTSDTEYDFFIWVSNQVTNHYHNTMLVFDPNVISQRYTEVYEPKLIRVETDVSKHLDDELLDLLREDQDPYNRFFSDYERADARLDPAWSSIREHRYNQFRLSYLANELKKSYERENDFLYDAVIRLTPHINFDEDLHASELENIIFTDLEPGRIQGIYQDAFLLAGRVAPPDFLLLGDSPTMDLLMNSPLTRVCQLLVAESYMLARLKKSEPKEGTLWFEKYWDARRLWFEIIRLERLSLGNWTNFKAFGIIMPFDWLEQDIAAKTLRANSLAADGYQRYPGDAYSRRKVVQISNLKQYLDKAFPYENAIRLDSLC